MPALGVADHLAVGKLAHFLADRFQRVVEAAGADRGVVALAHQFDQAGAALRGIAVDDQALDVALDARGNLRGREAEIARPHQFALAHRNAADDLRQIFAERDAHQQFLDLAERAGLGHAFGIGRELAHRFNVGGEPGQPVGGALLAVEQAGNRLAGDGHPFAHLGHRVREQGIERGGCFPAQLDQIEFVGGAGGGDGHGDPQAKDGGAGDRNRLYACSAQKQRRREIAGFFNACVRRRVTKLLQN